MYPILIIRDNLYRAKMRIQAYLGSVTYRTLVHGLKVESIWNDDVNTYLTELINDGAHKVAYPQ